LKTLQFIWVKYFFDTHNEINKNKNKKENKTAGPRIGKCITVGHPSNAENNITYIIKHT
jgi:hypothetical protein